MSSRSWEIQPADGIFTAMRACIPVFAVIFLALAAVPAHADGMRCGSRLISDGDTRSQVRHLCGEPTDVVTRTILRRPFSNFGGRTLYYGDGLIEVPVEVWTYNFGPYKLMRRVRFIDGLVDDIETVGHGYHESERDFESREPSEPRRSKGPYYSRE